MDILIFDLCQRNFVRCILFFHVDVSMFFFVCLFLLIDITLFGYVTSKQYYIVYYYIIICPFTS